jgi:predicted porin
MKFTKIAVAVASLFGAAAASAQTANVTVYGSIRVNVEIASVKAAGIASNRNTVVDNVSSRFGLRGSESLGGGLNAIFQLESGFASDTGANGASGGVQQIFSREAWVGLNGGFGELKLGYGLTPYDDVLGWAHHQGANSWENRNNGVSGGAGFAKADLFTNYVNANGCRSSAFDARYGNSVSYATPNISGFTMRTQYSIIDESAPSSNKCKAWDTAVRYASGPLRVGLTYAKHMDFAGLSGSGNTSTASGIIAPHDQDALRLYASFNTGPVLIDGTFETARYKPAAGSLKYKYWEIGALAPMGANTFGVQYSQRDKGLAALYNPATRALAVPTLTLSPANFSTVGAIWDRGGGKHLSFTHDYALSRRTLIRSYYTMLENEATATSLTTFGAKTKIRVFATGLWHSF